MANHVAPSSRAAAHGTAASGSDAQVAVPASPVSDLHDPCPKHHEEEVRRMRRERRRRIQNLHCYIAETGFVATGAAAAAISRHMEIMTWTESARLQVDAAVSAVVNSFPAIGSDALFTFGSSFCNGLSWLNTVVMFISNVFAECAVGFSDVISETRQIFAQEETHLMVLFSLDVCLVIFAASLALFAAAFVAPPSCDADIVDGFAATGTAAIGNSVTNAVGQTMSNLSFPATRRHGVKVHGYAAALLSFVAGSAATLQQPLRAALLLGI